MAIEETEAATPAAVVAVATKSGSLLKTAGIAGGLFLILLTTQVVAPVLSCKIFSSMTPNCPAGDVVVETEDKDKSKGKATATPKPKQKQKPKGPPLYLAIDPPLVVSLEDQGSIRFLQVTVELMARDEQVITDLGTHMPVIRNNLLMLLGGQPIASLTNREEKEKLRHQSLVEVQKIMKDNPSDEKHQGTVEELYFTSFVVQ